MRGPLPLRKVLALAVQIAEGGTSAGAPAITHRDMKLQNLVTRAEQPPRVRCPVRLAT